MKRFDYDIIERCEFHPISEELAALPFYCGDEDLEDFFHNEALLYDREQLGKTYCFIDNSGEHTRIVAFFTVANDSIKTKFIPHSATNKVQRKVPGEKHLRSYPAVLLGRLGVSRDFQGLDFLVGQQVMNYVKAWFTAGDNKAGCRFLVVDAYNKSRVIQFYLRNKFKFLYTVEDEERSAVGIAVGEPLHTRLMFLDLLHTEIIEAPLA